jgi:hypothetical protein
MKHNWTKNAFWDVNNKKWRKGWKFVSPFSFNNTYVVPVLRMDTKCPNQVFCVLLDDLQTIVLNRGCKLDSLQIRIFVYVSSTLRIVELKTRFKEWVTRNDVNGVRLFNLSYLITLMAYLCSQLSPNVEIKYFIFDWSINRLFVLNSGWKRDSLQMRIFVICLTWSMVQLKTRLEKRITRNDVNGLCLFHINYLKKKVI